MFCYPKAAVERRATLLTTGVQNTFVAVGLSVVGLDSGKSFPDSGVLIAISILSALPGNYSGNPTRLSSSWKCGLL